MTEFSGPMLPWPSLAGFGNNIILSNFGIKLYYYDSGISTNPPLLLIHGIGDDADTWRHVFVPLAEKYRVIALDLPGFGRSDKPSRTYSLTFLRDVIIELMDALGLGQVALMGNSLGAMLAEIIAIKHKDRVNNLVLVDGTVTAPIFSYHKSFLLMALPFMGRRSFDGLRGNPQAAYDSLNRFYVNMENLPLADREFLYHRVNQRIADSKQEDAFLSILHQLVWCLPLRKLEYASRLKQLGLPTHIIWGEKDAVIPVSAAYALKANQPGCKLTVLPETGHIPQQESPDIFLRAFLLQSDP